MTVKFCPIGSGSSGNSIYIGNGNTHILVDAGLSAKRTESGLLELNVLPEELSAIFITHEHIDHIKCVGTLSRRFDIPVFATPGTWLAMEEIIGQISYENKRFVYSGENCIVNDICIKPFSIPHDAAEPVAYSIFCEDIKMTVATDMGHITEEAKRNMSESDVLLIEANHDIEMLKNGPYPRSLKERILGEKGHISNIEAGNALSEITDPKLKYIYLGHLSAENNEPHLAYETVSKILEKNRIRLGRALKMDMAVRYSNSKEVVF